MSTNLEKIELILNKIKEMTASINEKEYCKINLEITFTKGILQDRVLIKKENSINI